MGPILDAIEAGHIATISDRAPNQGDLVCAVDRELWPCATIVEARCSQRGYADRLRDRAVAAAVKQPVIAARR